MILYDPSCQFVEGKVMKTIRIANGQGFWGDSLDAPIQLVERGPIDYLTLDYLAEITMSIMQKQKSRDPNAGYARDFLYVVGQTLPKCLENNIKIVANAGGVNPQACVAGVAEVVKKLGLTGKIKIGVVAGDDIMDRLDELIAKGVELNNMDTGEPLSTIRDRVAERECLFRRRAGRRSLETRRADRHYGPLHRHGIDAGADDPRIRMEARRLVQARSRDDRRSHHRVRRANAPAVIVRLTGKRSPIFGTSVTRLSRPVRTDRSSSPNTRARADESQSPASPSS